MEFFNKYVWYPIIGGVKGKIPFPTIHIYNY